MGSAVEITVLSMFSMNRPHATISGMRRELRIVQEETRWSSVREVGVPFQRLCGETIAGQNLFWSPVSLTQIRTRAFQQQTEIRKLKGHPQSLFWRHAPRPFDLRARHFIAHLAGSAAGEQGSRNVLDDDGFYYMPGRHSICVR